MQRPGGLPYIVDIGRRAADMQARRIMGERLVDDSLSFSSGTCWIATPLFGGMKDSDACRALAARDFEQGFQ
jgi:hypothetical protein